MHRLNDAIRFGRHHREQRVIADVRVFFVPRLARFRARPIGRRLRTGVSRPSTPWRIGGHSGLEPGRATPKSFAAGRLVTHFRCRNFAHSRRSLLMKIAQIAPLAESVPPKLYGGTERVVSYLTEELVRQGHDV